jgi:hypothetical protein
MVIGDKVKIYRDKDIKYCCRPSCGRYRTADLSTPRALWRGDSAFSLYCWFLFALDVIFKKTRECVYDV